MLSAPDGSFVPTLRGQLRGLQTAAAAAAPTLPFLPHGLDAKLHDYQKKAVQFAVKRGGRVLFCHEMGLGKTVMSLATVAQYRGDWPVLVVLPNVTLSRQWQREVMLWLGLTEEEVQVIKKGSDRPRADALFVIVTYSLLSCQKNPHLQHAPSHQPWKVIIADEAHKLKSQDSNAQRKIVPLMKQAARVIIMTGTPMTKGDAVDLYPLLSAVLKIPSANGKLWEMAAVPHTRFCQYFCDPHRIHLPYGGYIDSWKGVREETRKELNELLAEVMLRVRKFEVLHQLPSQHKIEVMLQLKPKEANAFHKQQAVVDEYSAAQAEGGGDEDDSASQPVPVTEINKLFMECAKAKVPAGIEWFKNQMENWAGDNNSGKCIIFAHHHAIQDQLREALALIYKDTPNSFCGPLDGRTPPSMKRVELERFMTDPACRIALLSMQAFGTGLNLTCASAVIFAEMSWSVATMSQAEARVHRMGQKENKVTYYYWLAEGPRKTPNQSPDLTKYNSLRCRGKVIDEVVDGGAALSNVTVLKHTPKRLESSSSSSSSSAAANYSTDSDTDEDDALFRPVFANSTTPTKVAREPLHAPNAPKKKHLRRRIMESSDDESESEGHSSQGRRKSKAARRLDLSEADDNRQLVP